MSARTCLRTALTCADLGGSPASADLVRRPAPAAGSAPRLALRRYCRELQRTAPMSITSNRPLDQPNQRRTPGRSASTRPGRTAPAVRPRSLLAGVRGLPPVGRFANCAGSEGEQVLNPWSSAIVRHSWVNSTRRQRPHAQWSRRVDVLREPQLDLVRGRRQRMGADVCVNNQKVHGVGTHVDHAKSHVVNLPT